MKYVCSLAINKALHREKEHFGLLTMKLWLSKNQFRLTITSVHNKLINLKTHEPINTQTHKPINAKTHEPKNAQTYELKKPST